jgi:hypothetical protein
MSEEQDAPRFQAHALRSVGEAKPSKHFKFLIVTPLLEFPVTPTKHSPIAISNRYKTSFCISDAFSGAAFQFVRFWRRLRPLSAPSLTPPAAFPIIAGFFQRIGAPVGGLCTKLSRTGSGKR